MIIGNVVALAIAIATIAASSYGVGREEHNKSSSAYQAATTFMTISIVFTIVFIISLILLILTSSGGAQVTLARTSVARPSIY